MQDSEAPSHDASGGGHSHGPVPMIMIITDFRVRSYESQPRFKLAASSASRLNIMSTSPIVFSLRSRTNHYVKRTTQALSPSGQPEPRAAAFRVRGAARRPLRKSRRPCHSVSPRRATVTTVAGDRTPCQCGGSRGPPAQSPVQRPRRGADHARTRRARPALRLARPGTRAQARGQGPGSRDKWESAAWRAHQLSSSLSS